MQQNNFFVRVATGLAVGIAAGLGILIMGWITEDPLSIASEWSILAFCAFLCALVMEVSYQWNKHNPNYHFLLGDRSRNKIYQAIIKRRAAK